MVEMPAKFEVTLRIIVNQHSAIFFHDNFLDLDACTKLR